MRKLTQCPDCGFEVDTKRTRYCTGNLPNGAQCKFDFKTLNQAARVIQAYADTNGLEADILDFDELT